MCHLGNHNRPRQDRVEPKGGFNDGRLLIWNPCDRRRVHRAIGKASDLMTMTLLLFSCERR